MVRDLGSVPLIYNHLVVRYPRERSRQPSAFRVGAFYTPAMRAFRRGLIVVFVAGVAGVLVRLRGKGGVPPTSGGWRELEAPDFR